MPIRRMDYEMLDASNIGCEVQLVIKKIEALVSSEMMIDELALNSSLEIDKYIIKKMLSGVGYAAGRLHFKCVDEKYFMIGFTLYFSNGRGGWEEVKGDSVHIPMSVFRKTDGIKLIDKGEISYDIDVPALDSAKNMVRTESTVVIGDDNRSKEGVCNEESGSALLKSGVVNIASSCQLVSDEKCFDITKELASCTEYKKIGREEAEENCKKMIDVLQDEVNKLEEAERQQEDAERLANDEQLVSQRKEIEQLVRSIEGETLENIEELNNHKDDFTVVIYGRTMAGKSTLMEILTHGNGSSIGKGQQRTTLDVRAYMWRGLKILDVPGVASFEGEVDDKLAYEAAKTADMAIFLLTDDAPQSTEADRLAELKALGKPVLGVVNVKQALSTDPKSPNRKTELKQVARKINEKGRLEEIVRQFNEFAQRSGYDFSDIKFVTTHLQAAYYSQPERENDANLYELSAFADVEKFIIDKIKTDGQFMCYKTYVDNVALPMQKAVAMLYKHSAGNVDAYIKYLDKIEKFYKWRGEFFDKTQKRYYDFIDTLGSKLDTKVEYVVNNYYESENAGKEWEYSVKQVKIDQICQQFIKKIADEATNKLRFFSDELSREAKYSGTSLKMPKISMEDITDWQGGLMMLAPVLGFIPGIGWAGAAVLGIGAWLFGDSKEEKIRKAKSELRGKLMESRNEIVSKIGDGVLKVLNEKILHEQVDGFGSLLDDRLRILQMLAYEQNSLADVINKQFYDLNFNLYNRAGDFYGRKIDLQEVSLCRIVGKQFIVFTTTKIPQKEYVALSNILSERVSVYVVDDEDYWEEVMHITEKEIAKCELSLEKFIDEEWGKMYFIETNDEPCLENDQIQLIQQIWDSPVLR